MIFIRSDIDGITNNEAEVHEVDSVMMPIQADTTEAIKITLRKALAHTLATAYGKHNGYIGEDFNNVLNPQSQEALRLFTAWRGKNSEKPKQAEFLDWVKTLFRNSGKSSPSGIGDTQLLVYLLSRSGMLGGKTPAKVLNENDMMVIVPALYAGFIGELAQQVTPEEREKAKDEQEEALKKEREAAQKRHPDADAAGIRFVTSPYSSMKIVEASQGSLRRLFAPTSRIGSSPNSSMTSQLFHMVGERTMSDYGSVTKRSAAPEAPSMPVFTPAPAADAKGKDEKKTESDKGGEKDKEKKK